MGNKSSLLLREEEIAQIQEETGCKYEKRRDYEKKLRTRSRKTNEFLQFYALLANITFNEFSVSLTRQAIKDF
jgi:hypothetical protein